MITRWFADQPVHGHSLRRLDWTTCRLQIEKKNS